MVDTFHGIAMTYGSSFFAQITSVTPINATRGAIETTHSLTTGAQTFMPTDLYDGGEVQIEGHYDNVKSFLTPLTAVPETVTFTWPLSTGQTVPHTVSFSGFMTAFSATGPTDNSAQAGSFTATLKVADDITVVVGS